MCCTVLFIYLFFVGSLVCAWRKPGRRPRFPSLRLHSEMPRIWNALSSNANGLIRDVTEVNLVTVRNVAQLGGPAEWCVLSCGKHVVARAAAAVAVRYLDRLGARLSPRRRAFRDDDRLRLQCARWDHGNQPRCTAPEGLPGAVSPQRLLSFRQLRDGSMCAVRRQLHQSAR